MRYDRRWLARLNGAVRVRPRDRAWSSSSLLAIAAALTVANVVRLAAHARRDEIEIMQLVGAPLAYVRGPFVAEGVLQGGAGALVAIVALWAAVRRGHAPGTARSALGGLGLATLTFLPFELSLILLLGGMLLGLRRRADRGAQGPVS